MVIAIEPLPLVYDAVWHDACSAVSYRPCVTCVIRSKREGRQVGMNLARRLLGGGGCNSSASGREEGFEEGHADEEAVAGLAEVGGAGVGVNGGVDLPDARERVQQDGVLP